LIFRGDIHCAGYYILPFGVVWLKTSFDNLRGSFIISGPYTSGRKHSKEDQDLETGFHATATKGTPDS